MGYIARAYVKIPRESVQNLIMEICELGYKNRAYHPCDVFWFIEDGYFYSREYTTEFEGCVSIDCNAYTPNGTEEEAVKLFLTLADMRDDAVENQWFCFDKLVHSYKDGKEEDLVKIVYIKSEMKQCVPSYYHRLTPLEVAEALRDGRIKL